MLGLLIAAECSDACQTSITTSRTAASAASLSLSGVLVTGFDTIHMYIGEEARPEAVM